MIALHFQLNRLYGNIEEGPEHNASDTTTTPSSQTEPKNPEPQMIATQVEVENAGPLEKKGQYWSDLTASLSQQS